MLAKLMTKLCRSSLCEYLQPPVTLRFLSPELYIRIYRPDHTVSHTQVAHFKSRFNYNFQN